MEGDRPFWVGGSVGVAMRGLDPPPWLAFSRGVDSAVLLLGGRPDVENDTEGGESTGKLLEAASRGCLRGESDRAATGGTVTSA